MGDESQPINFRQTGLPPYAVFTVRYLCLAAEPGWNTQQEIKFLEINFALSTEAPTTIWIALKEKKNIASI